jgi:crossover junction endonuclease EME1
MIVYLPDSMEEKLASQTRTFLGSHTIEKKEYNSLRPIVKWQRKVTAAFNRELDHWESVELHFIDEKHVMYVMSAKEFVALATGEDGDELDLHVVQLKSQFESYTFIYLIEGLEIWRKKNKTLKDRQFKGAVRSHTGQEAPVASQRPKKKQEAEYVDEDLIEDALIKLQMHRILIHHTSAMVETAEWILAFTQHISTIPYKYDFPFPS